MGIFNPITERALAETISERIRIWESLTDEQRASGDYINPDEPIVLAVPNPENELDEDEDEYLYYHVQSMGGGMDIDEDGNDCGHEGFQLTGMSIELSEFFYNGRRCKRS